MKNKMVKYGRGMCMVVEQRERAKPQNVMPRPANERVELIKRRTTYSEEFLNPDGTFTIELSDKPIHFKNKRGNWQKIDTNLVTEARGGYEFVNKDNAFTTRFARNNQNGQLVLIQYDDNRWIAFSPSEKFTAIGAINKSTIEYKGIRSDVDLRYIVDNDRIKEEIILRNYPNINSFTFNLDAQGLVFEKIENVIWVVDEATRERLFFFQKTYGEDAEGNATYNVNIDIIEDTQGRKLTITVDDQWLRNAKFPVKIDPSIGINVDTDIVDTYVSSDNPTTTYYLNNYFHAGFLSGYGTLRSYIRFKYLPSLPPGAKINNAYLKMFMYLSSTYGTTVDIHNVEQFWQAASVTWYNQPIVNNTPFISTYSSTPNTEWPFNITSLLENWYKGETPNYGVMIKASNESSAKLSFFSGEAAGNPKPKITINYEIDALGTEPYFGFDGNVNAYNGNLVLTATDVTLPGRGIPIVISRTYNLRSEETSVLGYRWQLNVGMRINFAADESVVLFLDGDGTKKYFTKQAGDIYSSPVGVQMTLKKEGGVFVLEEKNGVKYYFTTDGRLKRIVDTNNNTTEVFYQADGNIARIEDPSARKVYFNYTSGKLTSITGTEIPTVEYGYTGIHLKSVKKKNAAGTVLDEITFGHDIYYNLVSVTDDLYQTTSIIYSYTEDLGRRVYRIQKQVTLNGTPQTITTSYIYVKTSSGVITTVTDPLGRVTEYTTNNMGNIIKIIENKGGLNLNTQLSWDEQQNLVEGIPPKGINQPNEYKAVIQYDEDGNVKKIENAKNNNSIYAYNEKHDVTQVTDFAGRPTIYSYDPNNRNVTASADPLFATAVINYNSYGNVTSQTNPIGLGGNLLANTNFETWSGSVPSNWTKHSSGGAVAQDTTFKVNGNYSVKLTSWGSAENQRIILLSDFFEVKKSSKYNVSWYVRTENVLQANGGATVTVHWYNKDKESKDNDVNIAPTKGTTNVFLRKGARINSHPEAELARVALEVNDTGTAWFDNVQFELGSVINQYNLVYNQSFELNMDADTMPDGWVRWQDSIYDNRDGLDTTYVRTGTKSIILYGSSGKNKLIRQRIDLQGEAGVPIYFSGWSKSEGISSGGDYQVLLQVNYETGPIPYGANFTKSTHDWEFTERIIVTTGKFTSIDVYAKLHNHQVGKAWFDNFTVRLAGAPNALLSRYNMAENGNFEFDRDTNNWPDDWSKYQSTTPGTYSIQWLQSTGTEETFSENRMVKISNVPDWAGVSNTNYEPLKAGITYTASAVIKTKNASGSGAVLKFDILNVSNVYLGEKRSKVITGTTDWTRVAVSITTEEAKNMFPTAVKLKVSVGTVGATNGELYFDAVRMFQESVETKYSYDAKMNYVTAITNPLGDNTYLTRDSRGNVTYITDPKNNTFEFEYDDLDRIKRIDNPNGLGTLYYYDKNSNLKVIDNYGVGSGHLNTMVIYDYDELGLPKKVTDARGRHTQLSYNAKGNLTTVIYPNGKQINHLYDGADRINRTSYIGDTTTWDFGYDANSNITSITKNGIETISYLYDNIDQLTKITYPPVNYQTNTTDYGYTPMGEILNITDRVGATTLLNSYDYDYAGNNVDIIGPQNTSAAFIYDEERRVKKAFVKGSTKYYITYKDYDPLGRITRMHTEDNFGNIIVGYTYEYDQNGNRAKEINNITNKRKEYSYDKINQLKEERDYNDLVTSIPSKKIAYEYDFLGNRKLKVVDGITTTSYDYNTANEITKVNNNPVYIHDANGNLTDVTDSGWKYNYNAENQLIRVEKSGILIATYEYNGEGLRTKKVAEGRTERYYYNGDKLAYITDGNNKLRYYFTRDTQGKLLHFLDYSGQPTHPVEVYWYHYDAHGNVIGLWDKNGNKVATYTYTDAWGNGTGTATISTRDGILLSKANPFKYSGYQYDDETGFYYLKSRYYTPYLGRFITKDPILTLNQYAYAGNNPVNFIDPNGYLEANDHLILSKQDYGKILILSKIYDDADSVVVKDKARSIAVQIRRKYNPRYIDNYKYKTPKTYLESGVKIIFSNLNAFEASALNGYAADLIDFTLGHLDNTGDPRIDTYLVSSKILSGFISNNIAPKFNKKIVPGDYKVSVITGYYVSGMTQKDYYFRKDNQKFISKSDYGRF